MSNVRRPPSMEDFEKYYVAQPDGCWQWIGGLDRDGYGRYQRKGVLLAHRASVILHGQKIPDGMQIDHLCRNRACVNPDHLEIVTARTNTARGLSPSAINARKRSCSKGHPFDERNTYWAPNGTRSCRECRNQASRAYRARRAAA
jgi:hypothetical protein